MRTDSLQPMGEHDPPCTYIKKGEWPSGLLRDGAPPEVHLLKEIVLTFEYQRRKNPPYKSVEALAKRLKVTPPALHKLLKGTAWPNMRMIARMEILYNVGLWGNAHREQAKVKNAHKWPNAEQTSKTP